MARELDFRPLDFRQAILNNSTGDNIASAIESVGKSVSGAIEKRQEKKEAIKKDFIKQMTFDTSITGNNIINNRVSYEYGKLRDKYVNVLNERKGWLTAEDMINLRSEMEGLSNLANQLKSVQNLWDIAKKGAVSKEGRMDYELNGDNWGEIMSVVSGETDTNELVNLMNKVQTSDTGIPFLNYKPKDLNIIKNEKMKEFRNTYRGDESGSSTTVDKNGKTITVSKKTTEFGTDEEARNFFKTNLLDDPKLPNYTKQAHLELSDEEKLEAIKTYGPGSKDKKDAPLLEYYINNKMNFSDWTKEKEIKAYKSKPESESGGGGLNLFFGGGQQRQPGDIEPKTTGVQNEQFKEYVEFGKTPAKTKNLTGVTLNNAQLMLPSSTGEAKDIKKPQDYNVLGFDLEKDVIVLRRKISTGYSQNYMVPREGNENLLDGLFNDESMRIILNRAGYQRPAETKPAANKKLVYNYNTGKFE